ncbi:alanine--tRNA ligase-related protein [Alkalihalobacillus sp. MEB130]|uniref:alanyl-tRNA editing protein n=1 Tax=Alkalihalobacillus sp. MEB130 TaxID=2976704 RepID=UPI0028DF4A5B|nr:alanine--tRNA ligase-related protein [Alkalihalobacillus sp. MEB130]MDT8861664.1 alanine--tRNA ligase-related protein [Alkalihalobacillus sp. MEB130]
MVHKLYYQDVYQKEFYAKVVKQEQDHEGNWYVVLNETAFYPTGGGQPFDTGTIQHLTVQKVEEIEGEIRHFVSSPLETREIVQAKINWERRFDHMQQHTGQHILSAAFAQLFQLETVSFHLGTEISTIDLHTQELTTDQVKEAVTLSNEIILENRPIETRWVQKEELSQYQLRKDPSVTENIRLVMITNFDDNACGGTHPTSTNEVGSIKVLYWERQKNGIRVYFICGNRVLTQFDQKQQILLTLTGLVSAPEQDLPQVIEKRMAKEKDLAKSIEILKEELLTYEAKEILEVDELLIGRVYQERTIKELQKLAQMVTKQRATCTVFFVSENENRLQIVGARGGKSAYPCKDPILKELPTISGKGGGNECLVQGGGEATLTASDFLERLVKTASQADHTKDSLAYHLEK